MASYDRWQVQVDAFFERLVEAWQKTHARPPRFLYHYTSATGLLGILESRRMWATHAKFLNDPTELEYGNEVFKTATAMLRAERSFTSPDERLLAEVTSSDSRAGRGDAYVICFCAKGDVLSQWRAYAHGGGGYAMAFRSADMRYNVQRGPHFGLWRVVYDERRQVELVRAATLGALDVLNVQPKSIQKDELFIANLALALRAVLDNYFMTFKSKAFAEEREWRAIYLNWGVDVGLRFRQVNKLIVPYCPLAVGKRLDDESFVLPLSHVRFGPTLNPELADRSLRLILQRYDFPDLPIEPSGVPLRN